MPFQKKEINHINHPSNYKNLPVRLKRKSMLKFIKKREMISAIPKRKKLTTTTHLTIKTYESTWKEGPGWNSKKKRRNVSVIPKERNQPHQPQLQKLTSPLDEKVQVEIYKEKRNN